MQIATFDFHNTVAHCDPWFELEIRTLPAAVLNRLAGGQGDPAIAGKVTEHYRALRKDVIATGIERDAQFCVAHVFAALGVHLAADELSGHIDALMRDCLISLSPVPGAVETISSLIDADIPVGIISSAVYHPFLEWSLAQFGIRDRLAFVATSASIGYYKSVPTIYELAYGLVDADPALGVHIGDSPRWDIEVAQRAGLAAVLYEPGRQTPPVDHSFSPALTLETLVDAHIPITSLLDQRRARAVVV